jgi:hypothetical protein
MSPSSILKAQPSSEPKARGANRSTKAAGKLKVLPEQPDLPTPEEIRRPGRDAPGPSTEEESVGTTGDSDDADVDDDEPEVRQVSAIIVSKSP